MAYSFLLSLHLQLLSSIVALGFRRRDFGIAEMEQDGNGRKSLYYLVDDIYRLGLYCEADF